ncbi:glycosyltransferase [Hyphomonas sp.]|uniref:glycosyltransferase n=1 Tax=Hyphomonas sp. TaxID=87 RepID=UPI003F6E4ECF
MLGEHAKSHKLSVVLCTYAPRPDLLARALRAISRQTLHPDAFELVIVDNNSPQPLRTDVCEHLAMRDVQIIRELRQGLTYARVAGINATREPVICFVDDDNELAPDYLENVLRIAAKEDELGAWGGICEGAFETRVGRLQHPWLPHLGVRYAGPDPLTGPGDAWGEHEPIGAGICVRRHVAEGYVAFVESEGAAGALGRKGKALLSGEDSLISRTAHRLGYTVGYRPVLKLNHHITAPRLKLRYLARLMEGHGRSYITLQHISGNPLPGIDPATSRRELWNNFRHRLKTDGLNKAVGMYYWDKGYQAAIRDLSDTETVDQIMPALERAGLRRPTDPSTPVSAPHQAIETASHRS